MLAAARRAGPAAWGLPLLVSFVVAALTTATIVVLRYANDGSDRPTLVRPVPTPNVPPSTAPPTSPPVPPTTEPPGTQPPPASTATPPAATGPLTEWPEGADGYALVLASLPASAGRAAATAKAREAADAGLPEVGVLDSSRYSSLHPGYFVVFSGVYTTFEEASRFVDDAARAGYDTAYVRLIAS